MNLQIPIITDETGQAIAAAISQTDVAQARIAEINAAAQKIYNDLDENYPNYSQVLTELQQKTEKVQIDYEGGNTFKLHDQTLNFADIYHIHIQSPDFAFIQYGNKAYLCSYVNVPDTGMKEMRFESVINADLRTKVSSIYIISNDGIAIANTAVSDINSENSSNKVSEITETLKTSESHYPSTKAVADYVSPIQEELGQKQNTISDLEAIRSGAEKGATALQSIPNTVQYRVIADTGEYFETDTVEDALQELGALTTVLRKPEELTWDKYSTLVKLGTAEALIPVGTMMGNKWTDTAALRDYEHEFHVADYRDVNLETGIVENGAVLECHWAHPFGVQFSHERAFYACDNGLPAGTYYFTIESNWGTNVQAGDVVQFTLPANVPVGGKLAGCYGAPDQAKANWRIYEWSADGMTQVRTITPTINPASPSGTNLGIQHLDSRNGLLNSTQEMAYGWNRWKTSAIRQYLNSDKVKGQWWTAQDKWDIRPNELSSKDGFMRGVDPKLLAVVKPIKISTFANTVNDGGVEDITYDKFFLISMQEQYCAPQINGEGKAWKYWKEINGTATPWAQWGTYDVLKHYAVENHSSAQNVRLRSATRGNANLTWLVSSSGYVNNHYSASSALRFAPACVIG